MNSSPDIETIVVGGGVVGLAVAAACAKQHHEVAVIERRSSPGQEVSSRSSEVIHRGIYYPTHSLKAKLCVAGLKRLYEFAAENGVPTKRVGKLIVATSPSDVPKLSALQALAQSNGVDDLRWLDESEACALEPEVRCTAALYSPLTGIVDSHALMQALEGHLLTHGGSIILNTELHRVEWLPNGHFKLELATAGGSTFLTVGNLFVAAGLGMADLRAVLPRTNGYQPPSLYFAKGHYFTLQGHAPFHHLVYPVPVQGGLGIHLTLDLQGRARFGPDVHWTDKINYGFDDPDGTLRDRFQDSIRQYWPGLPDGALDQGYTGIRPKISGPGEPPLDFNIHGPKHHGIDRMVALYGIESPGLTSSLAIAEYALALCDETLCSQLSAPG